MRRWLRSACRALQPHERAAVGRAVALGDRRAARGRGERIAVVRDAVARADALIDRCGGCPGTSADEVVGDLDAAAKRSAAAVDRVVALGDLGHEPVHVPDRRLAGGVRVAGGAVAFANGRSRGAASPRDRVDDRHLADQAEAAGVVDTVAAGRGWGDLRRGTGSASDRERAENQQSRGEQDGEHSSHGITSFMGCSVRPRGLIDAARVGLNRSLKSR